MNCFDLLFVRDVFASGNSGLFVGCIGICKCCITHVRNMMSISTFICKPRYISKIYKIAMGYMVCKQQFTFF